MRFGTNIFLPLFVGALVVSLTSATHNNSCDAYKPHARHHHKHHHKSKHHHRYQQQQQQEGQDQGTNYNGGDSYGGTSSVPKNVANHHSSGGYKHNNTPFKTKAGVGGLEAVGLLKDSLAWCHNWNTKPDQYSVSKLGGEVEFATTVYGIGQTGRPQDVDGWAQSLHLSPNEFKLSIGFNEFDFDGSASAGRMNTKIAAQKWDEVMGPRKEKGALLISPSCAKQLDEDAMGPFLKQVQVKPDYVNVHAFSDNAEDLIKVLDHYRGFGFSMVVTETACINFNKHHQCSESETIAFIYRMVEIFENDKDVVAYAYADAANGPHSHLTKDGKLTKTGWAYKDAISKHSKRDKIYKRSKATDIPL